MFRRAIGVATLLTQACGHGPSEPTEQPADAQQAIAPSAIASVTACYASAESANPQRDIEVSGGGRTRRFAALGRAMDFVAEVHADPKLMLRYNAAGGAAIRAAMSCILDSGHVTLSTVVLNQKVEGLRVRAPELVELDRDGARVDGLTFVGMGKTCDGKPGLEFGRAARTRAFPVDLHGFDFIGSSIRVEICLPVGLWPCSGVCIARESTHPQEPDYCECRNGGGTCGKDISTVHWGPGGSIGEVQPM